MWKPGFLLLVGVPVSGKTTKALDLAAEAADGSGYPVAVVDSFYAWNLRGWRHAGTWQTFVQAVYGEGAHCAFHPGEETFCPREDFECACVALRAAGHAVIVLDEIRDWVGERTPGYLSTLLRGYQHSDYLFIATTQTIGDCPDDWLQCAQEVYIFRQESVASINKLCREFRGLDENAVRSLGQGQYIHRVRGFGAPSGPIVPAPAAPAPASGPAPPVCP